MSLKEILMQDMKSAMKEKDVVKKNVVMMIRAGILQIEKDNKVNLDDDGVIDVIAKQLKQRRDSLADFEKGARQDLVDLTNREIELLLSYMPKQLSKEEVNEIVKEAVGRLGLASVKDMGKLMADVMPKVKGRTDGKAINEAAKEFLS